MTRLLDLGVERYLVGACLLGVLAQRLVRTVCPFCSIPASPLPEEVAAVRAVMGKEPEDDWKFVRGKGCTKCGQTGYLGRTGIFELLVFSKDVKEAFFSGANQWELRKVAKEKGMRTMVEDGMLKVKEGKTTVGEVLRVTSTLMEGE